MIQACQEERLAPILNWLCPYRRDSDVKADKSAGFRQQSTAGHVPMECSRNLLQYATLVTKFRIELPQ
jgi:hypothetical protein